MNINWLTIIEKVKYPKEMVEGPEVLPFRRRRFFDYIIGTFAHPKLIVILISIKII
jgi:hypothetical protein